MIRGVAILVLVLGSGWQGASAEPAGEAKKEAGELKLGVWRVPPQTIPELPGKTREPSDARKFLESVGIRFPPGSDAAYEKSSSTLVVRNTQENLDYVEMLVGGCSMWSPANVAVEISTYECALPSGADGLAERWRTYAELWKLPPGDRKLLDVVASLNRGFRTHLSHVTMPAGQKLMERAERKPEEIAGLKFGEGETGTKVEVEVQVGPDWKTINAEIDYRFRRARAGDGVEEISFTSHFASEDGLPVVLHMSPVPGQAGKFVVVTGKVQAMNQGGWSVKELGGDKRETRDRKKRRSRADSTRVGISG